MKIKPALLGVAAIAALGVIAVFTIGGTDPVDTEFPADFGSPAARAERVGFPGEAAPLAAASATGGSRMMYLNSKFYTLGPQGTANFWMACRKGWKALNGYFYAEKPGVAMGSSFPAQNAKKFASRQPRWNFGMLNFNSSTAVRYYTGIVCTKGIRG
jgi:hypothetical protein